ncbi:MAG: NADH-quinone oxidoreductase subunit NuoF [bacterium]
MQRLRNVEDLNAFRESLKKETDASRLTVRVCMTGCKAKGASEVAEALKAEISKAQMNDRVTVLETGCHGFCSMSPVAVVEPANIFYTRLVPSDAAEIVEETLKNGRVIERLLYDDPQTGQKIIKNDDVPFYKHQQKVVLRNCGKIDPARVEDYIANGGYSALTKALVEMTPEEIVDVVFKSGLRGRGGAGFPTGQKWRFARQAKGDKKYIVCNADEGDPGAFMDRAVLEGDPHAVLEGMLIGAHAIGAEAGYIYVRAEYPIAVQQLKTALVQMRELGLLGDNILGTDFSFDIKIKEGAGAFVCGEETALLASIEGKRGMPRVRPPFPIQSGLWGYPTCINNVETLANIPAIILNGHEWYAAMGTEKSKGTKIFALAGMINNTGLVEVPMGITLREIIFNVGGGIPGGRQFKAALTGGPSGGCIPAQYLDLPIDYESLAQVGAIMGSGGLIVMDETTCIVDIARYFMAFTQNESCGKCVPCRMGTRRMLEMLTKFTEGKGKVEDLELLEELAVTVKDSSLCGLGQTAPNPVITTLKYFKEEYLAHIVERKCPSLKCKSLLTYTIYQELCKKCHLCAESCPADAITGEKKKEHFIVQEKCIKCGMCHTVCPFDAITIS